ncbi:hypothetical protein [Streptomyces poonensis]|uniref:Uncharacterized protein n=1 Tax=Streptomyces poonensis TaxID=68255 RepID=A0A918QGL7_9ACTN|nr:hypothetical protein [Streptomyces poonensis]GGZ44324.1 hypothetical protein GCM10010365_75950 [Streptomyces poonensis]
MTASPRTARAVDFLCEHTQSKSRVMALLDHDHGPRSLTAVLTCKKPDHAYEAVDILRRVLARRDIACVEDELRVLTTVMPDAPAGSLRQAVTHAATGIWPISPGTLYEIVQPDNSGSGSEAEIADVSSVAAGHPRLNDLPGKTVRIARLHEFHITDEDAVLRAAMDRGWEPLPASELADDDPGDLVGAVMTLTDDIDLPGAQTLEDQSVAELLSPDDGDELADWSASPITIRFHHGWRLHYARSRPAAEARTPNYAALFPLQECTCAGEPDEDCPACGWQLTPRTADLLSTALSILADQAFDDAERLGDQYLPDAQSTGWEVFDRLPPLTYIADHRWRRRMARAFDDLADDLAKGWWPDPTCTAEEMALHLAIEDAPTYLRDRPADDQHHSLPQHEDDYTWDSCSALLFQDHDVLMLFNKSLTGIEDPDSPANQRLGMGDLRLDNWFEPFDNSAARDPRRGFRR